MPGFVENPLPEGEISEIWENKEEKGLSTDDLKKKYLLVARSRFIRNPPVIVLNKKPHPMGKMRWPLREHAASTDTASGHALLILSPELDSLSRIFVFGDGRAEGQAARDTGRLRLLLLPVFS
jgi:hypothetical protein